MTMTTRKPTMRKVKTYAVRANEQNFDRLEAELAKMAETAHCDFVVARVFHAPRARLFKAWINPKQMAQWWGPKLFTNPVCQIDARPGGAFRIVMRSPDGAEFPF